MVHASSDDCAKSYANDFSPTDASMESEAQDELVGHITRPMPIAANAGRNADSKAAKRESFTIVSGPSPADVVSVYGSFPDDGNGRSLANSPPLCMYAYEKTRSGSPLMGDMDDSKHTGPPSGTARSWDSRESDHDSGSMSDDEDDGNESGSVSGADDNGVRASTVFVQRPATAVLDDEELVDVMHSHSEPDTESPGLLVRVHPADDASELSPAELLQGWEDATRSVSRSNTPSNGAALVVQPAGELVSAVYDVAADLNRRLSNWWHSNHPEDMPEDLVSPPSSPSAMPSTHIPPINAPVAAENAKTGHQSSLVAEKMPEAASSIAGTVKSDGVADPSKGTATSPSTPTLPEGKHTSSARAIWLLGQRYQIGGSSNSTELPRDFRLDFYSRIWCTYRTQFEPIGNTSFCSDDGWGCMMRTGQSLFAQALLFHYNGRGKCFH
ncbi:hypothetical protein THASP1DRAFT_29048 [Thamnocephalis sphaerospora]|uniref:Cysteine protease n=1 Tax=Thamnocephalis sphaerospora TaxID=78915 RepID=A0A4P9XSM6_9FUNG|nr:hypothetical protein THASP1DRAFT_29048 [Thamnocephalis sphaerospora]|eukprot:RKP09148.1 hypothetical protein THASP1DRAFT_29048 [Thamnocephalis sphaerospora]